MENRRWIQSPLVWLILAAVTVFGLMDVTGGEFFISDAKDNEFMNTVYYFCMRGTLVSVAGLCITMFAGTTLYAEDFEQNAVYMRIQRMGKGRYVRKRIIQTVVSAFLIGTVAMALEYFLFSFGYKIPMFPPQGDDVSSFSYSTLLNGGHYIRYLLFRCVQNGCCSVYYALISLLLSIFVPKRKLVVAVPLLLWYLNQFVFVNLSFIPIFLRPSNLFDTNYSLGELLHISDELGMVGLFGILAVMTVVVYMVFYIALGRKGIFGGDTE